MANRGAIIAGGVTAIALAAGMLRCTSSDPSPASPPEDAGRDARFHPRDASWDAGDDADAGVDADPCGPTPGPDGLIHDWPGYRRLTEYDPCLPADVRTDDGAGMPMSWGDCSGVTGVTGCKELQVTKRPPGEPPTSLGAYVTHDDAGGAGALAFNQRLGPKNEIVDTYVFDMKTSRTLGAWRFRNDLDEYDTSFVVSQGSSALTAFVGWRSAPNPRAGFEAAFGPAEGLGNPKPLGLKIYSGVPDLVTNFGVSTSLLYLEYQYMNYAMLLCSLDGGSCTHVALIDGGPAARLRLDFVWGDTVFETAEHGTEGWGQEYVIGRDGKVTLFRANPNAHVNTMRTDGMTLVWTEVYGSTDFTAKQDRLEVWTAPFTTDPAILASTATKLTTLPVAAINGEGVVFNGQYVVYLNADNQEHVVRLSDGAHRSVAQPAKWDWQGEIYVDANELWTMMETHGSPEMHLVRLPLPSW